jgi:hypothetical protein
MPVSDAVNVILFQSDLRAGNLTSVPSGIKDGSTAISPIFSVVPIEFSGCEAI